MKLIKQKIVRIIIFVLLFCIISCSYGAYEEVEVKVDYVRCKSGSIGSRSLVKVIYNEEGCNVKINKSTCIFINKGDTISLFYSKDSDRIIEIIN